MEYIQTEAESQVAPHVLRPNLDEAGRHLAALAPTAETFCFQTFDDDKERKDPRLARTLHGSLAEHGQTLINLNNRDAGVFVAVNEIAFGKPRKTENVDRVR